ncbi:MAG TPA: FAD-dependent oxidoreductase [Anaerolineae bacterium]|nr:FAD-dependent oxidoreductase [Anaerolineae bacterium]
MINYIIIGNGAAGTAAAEIIRKYDNGTITILSAEPYPMYSRPGLAYVLTGQIPAKQAITRTEKWYQERNINLVYARATKIDTNHQQIYLNNGQTLPYDRLLIATGARAVPPPYAGHDLDGVVYLDTMAGTKDLLQQIASRRRHRFWRGTPRAVVIGGGITALEMAEGLAMQKVKTHYFLRGDQLWRRVFTADEADLIAHKIEEHGVTIHYNTEIEEIIGDGRGRVSAVTRLHHKRPLPGTFPCDFVGAAIGVRPQISLVKDTPIATERGILVNSHLESNIPNIYAAGDCAQVYDQWSDKHLLDVLWPSAVAEGKTAGYNMVGHTIPYQKEIPFNVCLLFGLHIAIIGQISPDPSGPDEEFQEALSRGSSEVWFTFPRNYASAWSNKGHQGIRLAWADDQLVGALLIGNQKLAEPIRDLITHQVDLTHLAPQNQPNLDDLPQQLEQAWLNWRQTCAK